jgi:hypothetical protein
MVKNNVSLIINEQERERLISLRGWIFICASFVIIVVWALLSLTLLDEEWLKKRIEKYVYTNYNAQVKIDSLKFDPFDGHALLSGISLKSSEKGKEVSACINYIEIDVQVLPLLWRDVIINKIVISKPDVNVKVQRKPEPATEESLKQLEKLAARAVYEIVIRPFVEALISILEIFTGTVENKVAIKELIINDGHVNYIASRAGSEDFEIEIRDLGYSAKDVNARETMDFAINADITAGIVLGETEIAFSQHFSKQPITLSITNINMGYLDRYLKQKDILQVNAGNGSISFYFMDETVQAKAAIEGLEVEQNEKATQKDFAFVPIEKLIDYIHRSEGNLNVEVEIDKQKVHTSSDLQYFVLEVWNGMWKHILERATSDKARKLKEKITERLTELFKSMDSMPSKAKE